MRSIKLTHVGFRAQVKIAPRIVSYRTWLRIFVHTSLNNTRSSVIAGKQREVQCQSRSRHALLYGKFRLEGLATAKSSWRSLDPNSRKNSSSHRLVLLTVSSNNVSMLNRVGPVRLPVTTCTLYVSTWLPMTQRSPTVRCHSQHCKLHGFRFVNTHKQVALRCRCPHSNFPEIVNVRKR